MTFPSLLTTALGLALAAWPRSCDAEVAHLASYGPFTVVSYGRGQLSSSTFDIEAQTDGLLEARFVAAASHCSSLKMHFLGGRP